MNVQVKNKACLLDNKEAKVRTVKGTRLYMKLKVLNQGNAQNYIIMKPKMNKPKVVER